MKVLRRYVLKEVYHDREDEREDRAVIKYKEDLREYKSYIIGLFLADVGKYRIVFSP